MEFILLGFIMGVLILIVIKQGKKIKTLEASIKDDITSDPASEEHKIKTGNSPLYFTLQYMRPSLAQRITSLEESITIIQEQGAKLFVFLGVEYKHRDSKDFIGLKKKITPKGK